MEILSIENAIEIRVPYSVTLETDPNFFMLISAERFIFTSVSYISRRVYRVYRKIEKYERQSSMKETWESFYRAFYS